MTRKRVFPLGIALLIIVSAIVLKAMHIERRFEWPDRYEELKAVSYDETGDLVYSESYFLPFEEGKFVFSREYDIYYNNADALSIANYIQNLKDSGICFFNHGGVYTERDFSTYSGGVYEWWGHSDDLTVHISFNDPCAGPVAPSRCVETKPYVFSNEMGSADFNLCITLVRDNLGEI